MKINYFTFLVLLLSSITSSVGAQTLKQVATGSTPLYQYNAKKLQDLSGSAYVNGRVYLASDGGKNSSFPEVRVALAENIDLTAPVLQRQLIQRDIEGATQINNTIYVTSSMSQVNEDTEDYRVVSAMNLDDDGKIVSEKYAYGRDFILQSMEEHFGNNAWLRRVKVSFGKSGGLNVEGLSVSHHSKEHLVFGFRSPLYDSNFGSPELDSSLSLKRGKALLMEFDNNLTELVDGKFTLLDLEGQGIRGMEYIPSLKSYIIIAGTVEKQKDYHLWQYIPSSKEVIKLSKAGDDFSRLCRPESVLNLPEESKLMILSEQSGKACAGVSFNYITYQY